MVAKFVLALTVSFVVAPSLAFAGDAPILTSPPASNPFSTVWVIDGYVTDESPTTCMVVADGVVFETTGAAADGYFQFVFYLPPGYGGPVDVYAIDDEGKLSNIVYQTIGI